MHVNKKSLTVISSCLCLSASLSVYANEEVDHTIQNNKPVISFNETAQDVDASNSEEEGRTDETALQDGIIFENEQEGQATDIEILASESGFSIESVEKAILFQQNFARYTDKLLLHYPDQIASVYVEEFPATRGHIKFVGEVPEEIALEVEKRGQEDKIILSEGGGVSMADNHKRAVLVPLHR